LDVVGDRWTLLIVRELLALEACRYTDLQAGLPGIASNLLATRLRELEESGILQREDAPPPVAATLFRLTERGRQLESALRELGEWGAPYVARRDRRDAFRPHWMVLPLKQIFQRFASADIAVCMEFRIDGEPLTAELSKAGVQVTPRPAQNPEIVIEGDPDQVMGLLSGMVEIGKARRAGLRIRGDLATLRKLLAAEQAQR